jgi:hypothetical protein
MTSEHENPASRDSLRVYNPAPIQRLEHAEGSFTRVVEEQTAKVPSPIFLVAAMASMLAAVAFELTGRQRLSRFVGMWAPTLLTMGVYNKLVKMFGPR